MQAYFYFHNNKHALACGVNRILLLEDAMSLLKKETDNRNDVPFLSGAILYANSADEVSEYISRQ